MLKNKVMFVDDDEKVLNAYRQATQPNETVIETDTIDAVFNELGIEHDSIQAHQNLFNNQDFDIDYFQQGLDAVEAVEQALLNNQRYSVIVCDMRMPPGINGLETARRIRELDKETFIVFCSAYSDYNHDIIHKIMTDKVLFIQKPFNQISIQQTIYSLAKEWELNQERLRLQTYLQGKIKATDKELVEANHLLEYQSTHDSLTGLLNRRKLLTHIETFVDTNPDSKDLYLLLLDLDGFKLVNDECGHDAGDEVLIEMAARLKQTVRKDDCVFRYGGDEFHILLENIQYKECQRIAQRILKVVAEPFQYKNTLYQLGVSIGISQFNTAESNTISQLINHADIAMYEVKKSGKNNFALYDEAFHQKILEEKRFTKALLKACDDNEFYNVYQPIVNTETGEIVAYEALARWTSAEYGPVPPDVFIGLLEQNDLIQAFTEYQFAQILKDQKKMLDAGLEAPCFSLNVSPKLLKNSSFIHQFVSLFKEHPEFQAKQLKIEVTENILLDHSAVYHRSLQKLIDMGFLIYLDDFGTGYASINYLREYQFHGIKIDRIYTKTCTSNEQNRKIISALIMLSHAFGIKDLVAEGVETQEQADALKELGCTWHQGYFYARPMELKELINQT